MKKYLTYPHLVRIGLALVFLANSLIAFFTPSEFIELIENSFVANLLPVSTEIFVVFIGINDGIVALLLFFGIATFRAAAWAALWLFGVMVVRGEPLEILEEAGFLFMAVALTVNNKSRINY